MVPNGYPLRWGMEESGNAPLTQAPPNLCVCLTPPKKETGNLVNPVSVFLIPTPGNYKNLQLTVQVYCPEQRQGLVLRFAAANHLVVTNRRHQSRLPQTRRQS